MIILQSFRFSDTERIQKTLVIHHSQIVGRSQDLMQNLMKNNMTQESTENECQLNGHIPVEYEISSWMCKNCGIDLEFVPSPKTRECCEKCSMLGYSHPFFPCDCYAGESVFVNNNKKSIGTIKIKDWIGGSPIIESKTSDELEEYPTEIATVVTDIILNKEPGWSLNLEKALTSFRDKTEKAYGGCKYCYGKGYSTQIENYSGHGESDMGEGDIVIDDAAPYYLPCTKCDRGKQITEMMGKIREEEKAGSAEYIAEHVKDWKQEGRAEVLATLEEIMPTRGDPRDGAYAYGYNNCRKDVLLRIESLKKEV